MFDIGWSELLVIGVVAIIVVGPKDLPRMMRTFGHYAGKLRRAAADFQRQFEEAVRDSEIDEVRKAMQDFREQAPSVDLRSPVDKPLMTPNPGAIPPPSAVAAEAATPPTPQAAKPKSRAKRSSPREAVATKTVATKAVPVKAVPAKAVPAKAVPAKSASKLNAASRKPRQARKVQEPKP